MNASAVDDPFYYPPAIVKRIGRERHAVIEASAGTGKTFTIEHLVVDLLLSGDCAVDQILVVTFTEKATAELRIRIRAALEKLRFGVPAPQPAGDTQPVRIGEAGRKKLDDAFYSFDRAPIFTIHGFCNRVLTDFAFNSGTLLDLQLTDGRHAFHQAFRAELREHLAANKITRELMEKWLTGGVDSEYPKGKTPDDLERLLYDAFRGRYRDSADNGGRLKSADRLIANYDAKLLGKAVENSGLKNQALRDALGLVEDLKQRIAQARGSGERLLEDLGKVKFDALLNPMLRPGKRQAGLKFSVKARAIASDIEAVEIAAGSLAWELVDLLLEPVVRRLERDKHENGLIDYDDMLAWVWDALEGPGGAALVTALRERFRCALVDEFQDTDDLQWRIFKRIFVDGKGDHRLYVVGDPKQAIYAFRGADVFTYLKARDELTADGRPPIKLLDNFRSTAALINVCNHIFDRHAPEPLFNGAIRYDDPVRCGRPDRRALDARGNAAIPVLVMRYQRADRTKASAAEARAAIGRHIAAQLRELLFDDAHKITIHEDNAPPRTVKPSGVFVLTRTRQESAEIGEYLREAGVPFAFYKQDGLFQTAEASYVLDVLRAVGEPQLRSNRLKAWVSPFFAVPLRELALIEEVAPANALNERLYEWKAIAERGRFADLFDRLLHQSGLAYRELLLARSERRLTNYLHIFEILLAQALARRLALPEIIALLEDYISERALPEVEESNFQRLETEQEAVSVITVHMSKGLEADVVALFGGTGRPPDWRNLLAVYHDGLERRFAMGPAAKESMKGQRTREEKDENHRLLYVALTRARARLYLPMLPENSTKKEPDGFYAALNQRLLEIVSEPGGSETAKLFAVQDVMEPLYETSDADGLRERLAQWTPPPALMNDDSGRAGESEFSKLRRRHAPLAMRSYTSLRGVEETERWDIPVEEFKSDLEMPGDDQDLAGGREVGIFLHEVIEKVAMGSFAESSKLDSWRKRDDVTRLFRAAMHRHQIKEPWFERGTQAVFNALTVPLATSSGRTVGPICQLLQSVREMEFVYPIPESSHPLLGAAAQGAWTVERGYLKGFVDIVFEDQKQVYFADWKSDHLPSYEPGAIEDHVRKHYPLQAQIYTIGVIRLLQIRTQDDYERRFGGLLYIFLRGMDGAGRRGVYFHRPAWSEVCDYEAGLMKTGTGSDA